MKRKALITGITGQDGIYLARLLLSKGYEVFGLRRRTSSFTIRPIEELLNSTNYSGNFHLFYGDLTDPISMQRVLDIAMPDEVYNLAAQSHVDISFDNPVYTADATALGTLRLLESIRVNQSINNEKIKFYQASTSELYGDTTILPQNETTPFNPASPYAIAKFFAYESVLLYRKAYHFFASNGILFNHESPLRGENFVTRKITKAFAKMFYEKNTSFVLSLGNLNASRDWGHAQDYVYAMWLILQHDIPDDFVIATGIKYTVREFCIFVASFYGFDLVWEGDGINEFAYDKSSGRKLIQVDPSYIRPSEVNNLLGDASKAKKILGWKPNITIEMLVEEMCKYDTKDYIK
jgi:GDPmannose 4,6-dehydratase